MSIFISFFFFLVFSLATLLGEKWNTWLISVFYQLLTKTGIYTLMDYNSGNRNEKIGKKNKFSLLLWKLNFFYRRYVNINHWIKSRTDITA